MYIQLKVAKMMSLFITVGIVMLFPCRCPAQATLFQRSTEVRLDVGSSMELDCSVTGAIRNNRGWTGGPGFSTLITDGVSTDTSKYTESLQTVDFSLHIHNVVVDDVCGVDYQCYNGFDTSPIVTIVLNSSIFSYVPTRPEIIVQNEVYDTDKRMTIQVNLTKVFPEPTCTAKLGNKDVTFLSNSYNNGNCGLKSTEIIINNETYDCSGSLLIKCTVGSNLFTVYDVTPSSCLETSTTVKSSAIIESTSTSNFVESNAVISPTDISELNTLNIIPFLTDAANFSSSIYNSDRIHKSTSFETEDLETIDPAAENTHVFVMHTTRLVQNTLFSSKEFIQTLDSYKTSMQSSMMNNEYTSHLSVIVESGYESILSFFTADPPLIELTIDLLTSGLYTTTSEISSDFIDLALESSLSVTPEVHPTKTYFLTSIPAELEFSSSFTLAVPRLKGTVLTANEYDMSSKLDYQNISALELASERIQTYSQFSSEISLANYYSVSTLISFLTTHERPLINTNDASFLKTESGMGLFNSSLVNQNVLLFRSTTSNYIDGVYDSQYNSSHSESSNMLFISKQERVTISTTVFVKEDFSATTVRYSSIVDIVKITSDSVMSSSFYEQPVYLTHNSVLSSLTIKTLIQTSSVRINESESVYSEMNSSLTTKLYSSIPEDITKTFATTYDDKLIQLTSTDHILLVSSSLQTMGSFTGEIDNSEFITAPFVEIISRSSNELTTEISSLSPDVKITTSIQHGISESSKDAIFISTISGTIGAIILVFLMAIAVNKCFFKRKKYRKDEKEDEITKQIGWSDHGGMHSYSSHNYPFSGNIHLHFNSCASPVFPYADNYTKNWDDNI